MLYAAKCYWPGIEPSEFERGAAIKLSDLQSNPAANAKYLGSLVFASDELVLCLYESASRGAVMDAARRARIPCERILESAWLPATASPLSIPGGLP